MRKYKFILIGVLLFLLAGGVVLAAGDNYDIGRWVTSSGGGERGSEHYTGVGVIGQPGAGRSESENFTFEAGFLTVSLVTGTENATLQGHVTFVGRGSAPDPKWIEPFVVKGFVLGSEVWSQTATTDNNGVFTITGLSPGIYDIGIKNWTCLSEVNTSVTLTAGETTVVDFGTTREGDIDNNDWVYLGDLSAFCTAWNTKPGDGFWNANADLDRNEWVYLGDLSLFCTNWNQKGDLAP